MMAIDAHRDDYEERLAWLRLFRSENVGPATFRDLLCRFGTAVRALEALPDLSMRGGRRRPLKVCPADAAEREWARLDELGASLLLRRDPDYPPQLATLTDSPPVLSVLGCAALLKKTAIGIVGTRNASLNGRKFARAVAADLGAAGWIVVSGLARGIDAAAHEGALAHGTVAVTAMGLDLPYPEENRALFARIAERGAVISEMAPGTPIHPQLFPRRNRIIAGLGLGVVVVEAQRRSGSLITARLALDYGRDVFAVPGSPLDPRCAGTNALIRDGAAALTRNAGDVLDGLGVPARSVEEARRSEGFVGNVAQDMTDDEIGVARRIVREALGPSPAAVDEIVRQCQIGAPVVLTVLLEMELAGSIDRHPGGQVSLSYPESGDAG